MPARKRLKIQPEIVPKRLVGLSAEKLLTKSSWSGIRLQALAEAKDGRCTRCGAPNGSDVHEEWTYDYEQGLATLVGLAPICKNCHAVAHINQMPAGDVYVRVMQHLADVNGITLDEAHALAADAYSVWEEGVLKPRTSSGGMKPWRIEVSSKIVARYPDLAALPDRAEEKLPHAFLEWPRREA